MSRTARFAGRGRGEPQRLVAVRRPDDVEAEAGKAFWAIRALMSLSSAISARRPGGACASRRPLGRNSPARRSNSERARTGFTSHPSKPESDVCPKARRSNGENRTRLRRARGPGGAGEPVGRLGTEGAIDDDEIRPLGPGEGGEAGFEPFGALDSGPRLDQPGRDRRRFERRIGDDQRPRALETRA